MDAKYLTCAETAKLVRTALKARWPAVKFSVKSRTYSGGASIDIAWLDGPRTASVSKVTSVFEGADFDGMVDLKVHLRHWLMPDGSVTLAKCTGSGESIPAADYPPPGPEAVLVDFGADFIFEHRRLTREDELVAEAEALIRKSCVIAAGDKFGAYTVLELARACARDLDFTTPDTIEAAFRRVVLNEKIAA